MTHHTLRQPPEAGRCSAIAITWEEHRRTEGLCAGLGLPLFVLTDSGTRLGRYLRLGWKTLRLIAAHRPRAVLVQNPSLILALWVSVLRPFFGRYWLVVDAHNEAIEPYVNTRWPIPQLAHWVMRVADLTIVTNAELAEIVIRWRGQPFVLPDRLPDMPPALQAPPLSGVFEIMVIATYAPDEPIRDIVAAAARLGGAYRFRFTGRESKMPAELRNTLPSNVRLMGFLSEEDYWQLMKDSHVVLDLSLMPNCLVCGAYEALALGRPLILSASPASHAVFGSVAVLAEPRADDIERAVREACMLHEAQMANMGNARAEFQRRWLVQGEQLKQYFKQRQAGES